MLKSNIIFFKIKKIHFLFNCIQSIPWPYDLPHEDYNCDVNGNLLFAFSNAGDRYIVIMDLNTGQLVHRLILFHFFLFFSIYLIGC